MCCKGAPEKGSTTGYASEEVNFSDSHFMFDVSGDAVSIVSLRDVSDEE